jgi:protein-S-isoprenylcysteine O-methyltransferase Ste14
MFGLTFRQLLDLPPLWLALMLVAAWAQTVLLPGPEFGPWARFAGTLLIAGGLVLIGLAFAEFRRADTSVVPHQEPRAILTSGIYRFSRNPIYLADLLLLAGFSLRWSAWLGLILVPVLAVILTRRFILPEEDRLRAGFGPEFAQWASRTRRWL